MVRYVLLRSALFAALGLTSACSSSRQPGDSLQARSAGAGGSGDGARGGGPPRAQKIPAGWSPRNAGVSRTGSATLRS
jgi:hypothetical protein